MNRYDHDQMHQLYEQWQESGLTRRDFALNHGISPVTFYYWLRKFEKSGANPASGFQRITLAEPPKVNPGELMAVIEYPTGTRLELYSSFQHLGDTYVRLLKSLTS